MLEFHGADIGKASCPDEDPIRFVCVTSEIGAGKFALLGQLCRLTAYGLLSANGGEPKGVSRHKQLKASSIQTHGRFSSTVLSKTSIGFWSVCFPVSSIAQ